MNRIRHATLDDLAGLIEIENLCFKTDKLSRRSFRYHLQSQHSEILVIEDEQTNALQGYGLTLQGKGTRLARLYSLAISPNARGGGMGRQLLQALEDAAAEQGRLYMRLEVAANNTNAIALYESNGYRVFGEYTDYYEDHTNALRLQKKIRVIRSPQVMRDAPWYRQTLEFTCGPAALMMAMASFDDSQALTQIEEVDIWREATTIFMTSGHGGCHPFGLALAAHKRGFDAQVWLNIQTPLFIEGVRSEQKKQVISAVHDRFLENCQQQNIAIEYQVVTVAQLEHWLKDGYLVLMLISTYRLDGKKAPHWVLVTAMDDVCFYIHDPDLDKKIQQPIDCQYIPIAREDFDKMASFGGNRLRSAVAIKPQ